MRTEISLTENQGMIRDMARRFAREHLAPEAEANDRLESIKYEVYDKMAKAGLLGINIPKAYGGDGYGTLEFATMIEEFASVCPSTAITIAASSGLVAGVIAKHGSDDLKSKYLPGFVNYKNFGAFCLTEPERGSDARAISTWINPDETPLLLNGHKRFITNAKMANVFLVVASNWNPEFEPAMTGSAEDKKTIVIVDSSKATFQPIAGKMGMRGATWGQLDFKNAEVNQVLGGADDGWDIAMDALVGGRIVIAAMGIGIARAAMSESIKFANERYSFGKPIIKHQAVSHKIADMAMGIEAASHLTYNAAIMRDRGFSHEYEASIA